MVFCVWAATIIILIIAACNLCFCGLINQDLPLLLLIIGVF